VLQKHKGKVYVIVDKKAASKLWIILIL
jgi:hypothetical protein